MSAVAAPADRRFRRAHVKPARKRIRWIAAVKPFVGYSLLSLAAAFALYRAGRTITNARMFRVDHIVVTGNQRLSSGEVVAVLDGLRGESVVWLDLDRWRQRLLAAPWVRDAALRRSLPATVDVVVTERQPVGIGRLNGDMYLIDESGTAIDQYGPQYADLDLPIIDGLGTPGSSGNGDRSELIARVVAAIKAKPQLARRVSQIDVSDAHNASVILSGDPAVLYVGDDRFLPRLQSYVELADALRERVTDIDYVDLRFDDRIYIGPHHTLVRTRSGDSAKAPHAPANAKR